MNHALILHKIYFRSRCATSDAFETFQNLEKNRCRDSRDDMVDATRRVHIDGSKKAAFKQTNQHLLQ